MKRDGDPKSAFYCYGKAALLLEDHPRLEATKEPPRAYFVMQGIGTGAVVGISLLLLPHLHS